MPILKFHKKNNCVVLEKLRMEDITNDKRTSLLSRTSFICQRYKVDSNVYIAKNDMFFKMARVLNRQAKPIDAMIISENNVNIIIVPCRSYVFWNGRSIEPEEYSILQTPENMELQRKVIGSA